MKKKWVALGSAIGISSIVMVTAGMSVMAGTSGYDAYKSALKTTKSAASFSVQAEAAVKDNGAVLTSANGSFKASRDNGTGSGRIEVASGGAGQKLSFYKQDDGVVFKTDDSDVYYVKPGDPEKEKRSQSKESLDPAIPQQVETVIDALVGNLKDYVAVDEKADGSKEVSVELTGAQIPAVVNAIVPIAVKRAADGHGGFGEREKADGQGKLPFDKNLLANKPQLSQDIKIDKIGLKAVIDESNFITHQEAAITISGKDDAGTPHVVSLQLNADFSDYNSTIPDQADLTGQTIQTIENEHKWKRGHGR